MGKIITCMSEKGGVAKTTTVKNVAVGLALNDKKVLAVDLDPSANLTSAFGVNTEENKGAITEVFNAHIKGEELPIGYGIVTHDEGIDVVTSGKPELRELETSLICSFQREVVLRNYLMPLKNDYDYILIDCPAGLGIFSVNALFCADEIIIPVLPHLYDVDAMQSLFALVAQVRKANGTGNKPSIMGALFTNVRSNTNNDKNIMKNIRNTYDNVYIFKTIIPQSSKIPETDLYRKSIFSTFPSSSAALSYMELVKEILTLEKNNERGE